MSHGLDSYTLTCYVRSLRRHFGQVRCVGQYRGYFELYHHSSDLSRNHLVLGQSTVPRYWV